MGFGAFFDVTCAFCFLFIILRQEGASQAKSEEGKNEPQKGRGGNGPNKSQLIFYHPQMFVWLWRFHKLSRSSKRPYLWP